MPKQDRGMFDGLRPNAKRSSTGCAGACRVWRDLNHELLTISRQSERRKASPSAEVADSPSGESVLVTPTRIELVLTP